MPWRPGPWRRSASTRWRPTRASSAACATPRSRSRHTAWPGTRAWSPRLQEALRHGVSASRTGEFGGPTKKLSLVDDETIEREIVTSRLALAIMDRAEFGVQRPAHPRGAARAPRRTRPARPAAHACAGAHRDRRLGRRRHGRQRAARPAAGAARRVRPAGAGGLPRGQQLAGVAARAARHRPAPVDPALARRRDHRLCRPGARRDADDDALGPAGGRRRAWRRRRQCHGGAVAPEPHDRAPGAGVCRHGACRPPTHRVAGAGRSDRPGPAGRAAAHRAQRSRLSHWPRCRRSCSKS